MKTKSFAAFILLAAVVFAAPALPAQSINVSVIGTVTPAACLPTLAGGGVVDYGNIPASGLNMSTFNVLPSKAVAFSVTCAAPMRIAISTIDNRLASVVPGAAAALVPGLLDSYNFGLGTVSGANVGGYTLTFGTFTIDGSQMQSLTSMNGGTNWFVASPLVSSGHLLSWGISAVAGPQSGKIFSGTLIVTAILNKGAVLPLTSAVPLDGLATMTIVYL